MWLCLAGFGNWKMFLEVRATNKGAFLMAQSATKEDRAQSYVATGQPAWLQYLLDSEKSTVPVRGF